MNEEFANWAKKQLGGGAITTKEKHGDQSDVFRFETASGKYFLKIGKDLEKERQRLEWLREKTSVPKVIGFMESGNQNALLLSAIEGQNLAVLKKEWPAEKIVDRLAEVIKKFHAVDAKNCPFGNIEAGKVLVHGDACLPNFIFNDNNFSGYVDLGDMTVDSPEIDFAAAIWSLQYNLGKGHGLRFLEKYGVENATEELVEKLRLKYEEMQKKWGL